MVPETTFNFEDAFDRTDRTDRTDPTDQSDRSDSSFDARALCKGLP